MKSVKPVCCAVLLLVILVFTLVLRNLYTPLYTPLTCWITRKDTIPEMVTTTRCINENSFDMHMTYPDAGDVWLLTNRSGKVNTSQVGSLHRDPFTLNRYGGEATVTSRYKISMRLGQIGDLAVAEKVQFMERVPAKAYATLNLAIANINTPWFKSEFWCGYSMKKFPPMEGSSVCFETQDQLIASIPPADTPADAPIKMGMDPGLLAKAAVGRDCLTMAIVIATLVGSAKLLRSPCIYLVERYKRRQSPNYGALGQ